MRRAVSVVGVVLLASVAAGAQKPVRVAGKTEFVGKIDGTIDAGRMATSVALNPATDADKTAAAAFLKAGDVLFVSDLRIGTATEKVYLMTSDASAPGAVWTAVADVNRDGTIQPTERFALAADAAYAAGPSVVLPFAAPKTSNLKTYPIRIGVAPAAAPKAGAPAGPVRRYLTTSWQQGITAVATIDGAPVKVRVTANSTDLSIDPTKGYQYVDCNGDGQLDDDMSGWEMGYARGTPVVFHIGAGTRYVAITSVHMAAGTVTLTAHSASDYTRVEMRTGAVLPDFSFKALDGTPKKLSDFRGKYVMLDFWGTWCSPCVGEIPYMKAAYDKYRAKGFEIIGLDNEFPSAPSVTPEQYAAAIDKVKAFVVEKGVTWTQSQSETIRDLVEKKYQVVAYPTAILIDPNGIVISVDRKKKGEPGLRGDDLEKTLAAIFAKSAAYNFGPWRF